MKRTLSLLMAVLMLTAVVLTGCSSGGTTSGAASSSDASSASSEAESESSAAEENDLLAQIKERAPSRSRWKALGRRGHTTMPMITLSAMT